MSVIEERLCVCKKCKDIMSLEHFRTNRNRASLTPICYRCREAGKQVPATIFNNVKNEQNKKRKICITCNQPKPPRDYISEIFGTETKRCFTCRIEVGILICDHGIAERCCCVCNILINYHGKNTDPHKDYYDDRTI